MLTTSVPSSREAVVQLPVSTARENRHQEPQNDSNLVVRKPAPDATQPAGKVEYTVVHFSY